MGLCGGFPMSTEFFFLSHYSALFENVIFSNNYDSVFIDSNLDFSVISIYIKCSNLAGIQDTRYFIHQSRAPKGVVDNSKY
jgi:hypothetical protein